MATPLEISASGLVAQRIRMDTIAENIANVSTTRDIAGRNNPYVRKAVIFQVGIPEEGAPEGVHVAEIRNDDPSLPGAEQFRMAYEPGNPDADAQGYVRYPNVDLTREFVNALEASRAYEANIQAFNTTKQMGSALDQLLQ